MVNKPLIRPYFLGGVALGGAARIPLKKGARNTKNCQVFRLFSYLVGDTLGILRWDLSPLNSPPFGRTICGIFS